MGWGKEAEHQSGSHCKSLLKRWWATCVLGFFRETEHYRKGFKTWSHETVGAGKSEIYRAYKASVLCPLAISLPSSLATEMAFFSSLSAFIILQAYKTSLFLQTHDTPFTSGPLPRLYHPPATTSPLALHFLALGIHFLFFSNWTEGRHRLLWWMWHHT